MKPLLVLDLDGVLIGTTGYTPIARPGLQSFLGFVFQHFEVGIWTASSQNWYTSVKVSILQKMLENINRTFLFEYHSDKHIVEDDHIIKPLDFIFHKFSQYNNNNTLIIDDSPETYIRNPQNTICIPSYTNEIFHPDDSELEIIQTTLSQISGHIQNGNPPSGPYIIPRSAPRPRITQIEVRKFMMKHHDVVGSKRKYT